MRERFDLREILRFLVGGGSAVLTDFAVYQLLMSVRAGIDLSKGVSYVLGASVGFVINKFWTFRSKRFHITEIGKYVVLYAFSALVNTGVNRLVLAWWGIKLIAFLLATAASTVINFLGQKYIVFKQKGREE
ncbi:MAG: GtrA family protein [Oscillospiraceae bacterium]|nr:GtrA family protein [Oscillospiraceae bacterium]